MLIRSRTNATAEKIDGILVNGYDYELQCWVVDGVIQRCGHPAYTGCECFGRRYAGALYAEVLKLPSIAEEIF